jgi:tetratricopeptide (TPR) repeat protein
MLSMSAATPPSPDSGSSDQDRADLSRAQDAIRAGDLVGAERVLAAALERTPDAADALVAMGYVQLQLGDPRRASDFLEYAVSLAPGRLDALVNLGVALRAAGNLAAAETQTRAAIAVDSNGPGPWNNLGLILQDLDRWDEAEAAFRRALELEPRSAIAWNSLGNLLERTERGTEAVAAFSQGLSVMPDHLELLLNLGGTLGRLMREEESLVVFRRALMVAPNNAAANMGFAHALLDTDHVDEGLVFLRAQADAGSTYAKLLLADCYEKLNRLEDSREALDAVAELAAEEPLFVLVDAKLHRRSGNAEAGVERLRVASANTDDDEWRCRLHYELGRCLDTVRNCGAAYDAFVRANELAHDQWRAIRPGPNMFLEELRAARAALDDPDALGAWRPLAERPSDEFDSPVFLIGFPRSGTTLLDQILDAHPSIQVLEERPMFVRLRQQLAADGGGDPFTALSSLDEAGRALLREHYTMAVAEEVERVPGTMLIDKLPIGTANAHVIRRVFPDSKIILAVRHPCDVVLSCFMQEFTLNGAMANFYSLADAVTLYEETWRMWQRVSELFGSDHVRVRYEDLLEDPEAEARALLEFLGLPYDENVMRFAEHARKRGRINTPSYHQVSQPIYTHARYRWQRYHQQLLPSLERLAPFAVGFDYPDPRSVKVARESASKAELAT